MSFEIYGADMSNPANREDLVEIVTAIRNAETDFLCDSLNGFDIYDEWASTDRESYKDFVEFCVNHDDEEARRFIASRCDYLLESEISFTFRIFTKLLEDNSQQIRFGAAENAAVRLSELSQDREEEVVTVLGLNGLRAFTVLLAEVIDEKRDVSKQQH